MKFRSIREEQGANNRILLVQQLMKGQHPNIIISRRFMKKRHVLYILNKKQATSYPSNIVSLYKRVISTTSKTSKDLQFQRLRGNDQQQKLKTQKCFMIIQYNMSVLQN
ncbi:hypothetical protein ABPG74_007976 [Tetrahymena malaccensis]